MRSHEIGGSRLSSKRFNMRELKKGVTKWSKAFMRDEDNQRQYILDLLRGLRIQVYLLI
jgi:hypothetical protein